MHLTSTLVLLLAGPLAGLAARNNHCPPLGAALPAPVHPGTHAAVASARALLVDSVTSNFLGGFNHTALSLGVASLHETAPLLDLHHTPPELDQDRGARDISAQTVYRIGSITKAFVVLAALQAEGVRMDDPVTLYLPQLRDLADQQRERNALTTVDWDEVTVEALASHMGGIPTDLATDLSSFPVDWTAFGLPPAKNRLGCVGFNGIKPCNSTDCWANFGKRQPVFPPYTSPLYSNVAFFLLGLVVEAVTNTTLDAFVQTHVLDAAGMHTTFFSKPDDSLGAISPNDGFWDAELGILDYAGGYYSTTHDLLAFGSAILGHNLLSPAETNRWLKPRTFTSSPGLFLGAPWEIMRSTNLTRDQRPIQVYTKGGDLGTYHGMLALVPDYDLVISILTSGPEASAAVVQRLFSQAVTTLLPGVDAAARDEAAATFAGRYLDPETNSTLVLESDDEGPGLTIRAWIVRGTDVVARWLNYLSALSSSLGDLHLSARLYPSGLTSEGGKRTAWRAAFDLGAPDEIEQANSQLFWSDASCLSWALMDRAVHEFKALDELIFTLKGDTIVNVELAGFQTTLRKATASAADRGSTTWSNSPSHIFGPLLE